MRALLGVSDKQGIVEFARELSALGVELVATGGTARVLSDAGVAVRRVSDITGFPEMLDGRVRTLHPAVHAGILARRDLESHMAQLREHGFAPIDLVVVSLYPFRETVASGAGDADVIENIDIGGPTMIRAAAKNSDSVAVVVSPRQYPLVLAELREHGEVRAAMRTMLAAEAFAHVAAYDAAVAAFLQRRAGTEGMPLEISVGGEQLHALRYGENPHQRGALYGFNDSRGGVARAAQLQGSPLSFTNWLDVDSAFRLAHEFEQPAACVMKHTNPCGAAVGDTIEAAYRRAYDCDPRSAYGGIVGLNRAIDEATAAALTSTFLEAVIAPGVEDAARERLAARQRLRVLVVERETGAGQLDVRSIDGGLLVQTQDRVSLDRALMTVASSRAPSDAEWDDMLIAWRVCRHVKSNAVVIVSDGSAIGVGAGQMSRVEAAELAVARAAAAAQGAVAASDAFFPMPDGLETLGRAGVRAVIHPGGSKNDAAVIAAADALGMAVVHTGERHFRH